VFARYPQQSPAKATNTGKTGVKTGSTRTLGLATRPRGERSTAASRSGPNKQAKGALGPDSLRQGSLACRVETARPTRWAAPEHGPARGDARPKAAKVMAICYRGLSMHTDQADGIYRRIRPKVTVGGQPPLALMQRERLCSNLTQLDRFSETIPNITR
jgi:hypothetical protein